MEEAVGVRDKCGLEFPKVFQNGAERCPLSTLITRKEGIFYHGFHGWHGWEMIGMGLLT
jgi:hypothetical protein